MLAGERQTKKNYKKRQERIRREIKKAAPALNSLIILAKAQKWEENAQMPELLFDMSTQTHTHKHQIFFLFASSLLFGIQIKKYMHCVQNVLSFIPLFSDNHAILLRRTFV